MIRYMHFPEHKKFCVLSFCYINLFIFSGLMFVCTAQAQNDKKQQKGPPPRPVVTRKVEARTVSEQVSLVGTAESASESVVASEVSGIVKNFPVQEGDYVKKGQILAELKTTNLDLLVKAAVAVREETRTNLEHAKKELERYTSLKKADSIADRQYDEALYTHNALAEQLKQREARIEQLKYEIRQKKVRAPFSGFISEEHTQVGEWINPGGPVVTLIDLEKIRITVDVPERYAVMVKPDTQVDVEIPSLGADPYQGKIHALLPQGDPESRTFPVRILLTNPEMKIKSGMEAMVRFSMNETTTATLVPKDAVVTSGANRMVYVVMDGKAVPMTVKIKGYYDGSVSVEGGIEAGMEVVVRGNERLLPGQPVKIINGGQ